MSGKRIKANLFRNCDYCGIEFPLKSSSDKTLLCSDECRKARNQEVKRGSSHLRKFSVGKRLKTRTVDKFALSDMP